MGWRLQVRSRAESSVAHSPARARGPLSGWGLLPTLAGETVCCCAGGSGDSPGPIRLEYPPKQGLSKDLSLPSSAFPRCSYLGENNRRRLCFQQMGVRKRLCDSGADKRQPGRGASGWDGAPRQPPPLSPPAVWGCPLDLPPATGWGWGTVRWPRSSFTPGFHFVCWFILYILSPRWVLPPSLLCLPRGRTPRGRAGEPWVV